MISIYARGPKGCTDLHAHRLSNHRIFEAKKLRKEVMVGL